MATEVSENLVDLMAKEIEETRLLLVSINLETRNDGIAQTKRLLLKHSGDTSDAFQLKDYLMIWRGLINFMWKSDKLLPQGSAIEKISYLIHSCTSYQGKILFLNALFITIKDECLSISQHHIDKCMMLVRRFLRQFLFTFFICDWNFESMIKLSEVLYTALESFTLSLRTRLQDIFLEELAKVSRENVSNELLVIILDSFLRYISELNGFMLVREVTQNIFINLLFPPPDLKMLEAKFQARRKIGKSGKSYNDLEMTCIEFNPQDIAEVLKKYVTEVDCTRKCSLELTKSTKYYNCLGDCIQPYKPKHLKINSQVLKQRKKKYPSKMVYEGVKKLEIVDSKSKKKGRAVNVHKSFKELNKLMGEIVLERGKIGTFMWKVRKFDNTNTLNKNFNLNRSWTVSEETKHDGTNTVCMNDDEPPRLVPAGFKVEVLEIPEKTTTKDQKNVSTPNENHAIDSKINKPCKEGKHISITSVITPNKSFKSPESHESPTFEQKVLRRRTIIIFKKRPDGQNEGTPKRKMQETSASKVVQKRRKIKAEEEISVSKPKEILIKAHEKVQNETFENGFGSLRRSPRLSIKPDFYQF